MKGQGHIVGQGWLTEVGLIICRYVRTTLQQQLHLWLWHLMREHEHEHQHEPVDMSKSPSWWSHSWSSPWALSLSVRSTLSTPLLLAAACMLTIFIFHVQANPSYFSSSLLFCFITLQSNDICINLRLPLTHKSYLFHLPMQINRLLLIVCIIPYQEPARLVWNLQAPQWQ